MVHMGCVYLTEKQMPPAYWFDAIMRAVRLMNAIPGNYTEALPSHSCWFMGWVMTNVQP
jgi:hypothetical protein